MASDKKISEALGHIQAAQKCLKTSFFKWNPDLDGASSEYIKAATCYRNAKLLSDARDMYLKAADIQMKMNAPFHAAKSLEQAGLLSKENKEIEMAVDFMERAAHMFQEDGTPSTAAICLEKAGKMVEQSHPTKAVELYRKASTVAEIEDRPRQCAENIGKAGRILIRLQRYEEAVNCLSKEIEFYLASENYAMISKIVLGIVMLKLTLGDFVDADNFYRSSISYPQFSDSEEAGAIEQLLQSYDDGDEEAARRVLALPLIKYMDNAFAKLARDLDIPGGMAASGRRTGGHTEGGLEEMMAEATGSNPGQLEEDEFEGGLC